VAGARGSSTGKDSQKSVRNFVSQCIEEQELTCENFDDVEVGNRQFCRFILQEKL